MKFTGVSVRNVGVVGGGEEGGRLMVSLLFDFQFFNFNFSLFEVHLKYNENNIHFCNI